MQKIIHRAESRGHANHGWLDSHHSFSFANYYDPSKMGFGALRVLNDDRVAPSGGFGTHPHNNMEIISIPLSGDLEHKDSMGNVAVIKEGDVQVLSAGTGIFHSEYNKNQDKEVRFLQIWVIPNKMNVEPRYDQISIRDVEKENAFYQILSPNKADDGVWIHQDAWFHMGQFEQGRSGHYSLKNSDNGLYVFVLEGQVDIEGNKLNRRDAIAIWETNRISLDAWTDSKLLLMEIPLN